MKKFLTKLLAIVMCFSIGISVVGCDNSTTEKPTNSEQTETQGTETSTETTPVSNKKIKLNKTYKGALSEEFGSDTVHIKLLENGAGYMLLNGERFLSGAWCKFDDSNYAISIMLDIISTGHLFSRPEIEAIIDGGYSTLMIKLNGNTESIQMNILGEDFVMTECEDTSIEEGVYVEKFKGVSGGEVLSSNGSAFFVKDEMIYKISNYGDKSVSYEYNYQTMGEYICLERDSIWGDGTDNYSVLSNMKLAQINLLYNDYDGRYYQKQERPCFNLDKSNFTSLSFSADGYYYKRNDETVKFIESAYTLQLLNDGTVTFDETEYSGIDFTGRWYVVGNQILVIADEDGVGHIKSFAIGMAEDGEFSLETLLSSPYMSFYDGSTRDDMTFTIAWTESAMTYCDELYGITR